MIKEMGEHLSDLVMWSSDSGFDTPGCRCNHEGLGPEWHLNGCVWATHAWRRKAFELAKRLDAGA